MAVSQIPIESHQKTLNFVVYFVPSLFLFMSSLFIMSHTKMVHMDIRVHIRFYVILGNMLCFPIKNDVIC